MILMMDAIEIDLCLPKSVLALIDRYNFLCNKWLAIDEGDGKLERVLTPASDDELVNPKTVFEAKASEGSATLSY